MRSWLYCVVVVVALLLAGSCARNQPPEIIAAKAFPDTIDLGDSASLIVSVADPEHGRVRVKWQSKDGKFASATDSLTTWYAPSKPGNFQLSVTVTDGKGASVRKTLGITVTKAAAIYSGSLGGEEPTTHRRRADATKTRTSRRTRGAGTGDDGTRPTGRAPRRSRTSGKSNQ